MRKGRCLPVTAPERSCRQSSRLQKHLTRPAYSDCLQFILIESYFKMAAFSHLPHSISRQRLSTQEPDNLACETAKMCIIRKTFTYCPHCRAKGVPGDVEDISISSSATYTNDIISCAQFTIDLQTRGKQRLTLQQEAETKARSKILAADAKAEEARKATQAEKKKGQTKRKRDGAVEAVGGESKTDAKQRKMREEAARIAAADSDSDSGKTVAAIRKTPTKRKACYH